MNDRGQLYTMEGLAAALIVLVTAWLVLDAPAVYAPGDAHISEMQLAELGTDALAVLDTPASASGKSELQRWVEGGDGQAFAENFSALTANRTGSPDRIGFNATLWYRDGEGVASLPFATRGVWTGHEEAVRVSRWVHVTDPQPRILRLEVMMWRA
ncbi:MAG: DUF7288 family protein [Methanomicrobiales archaeon]